jgi:hypothetical protein
VLKKLFGRNASEDERANELRKLNEARHARVKKHEHDSESPTQKPAADKPE